MEVNIGAATARFKNYNSTDHHEQIEFFVEGRKQGIKAEIIQENIEEVVESVSLKVERILVNEKKAQQESQCRILFNQEDLVAFCSVSNTGAGETLTRYHALCTGWNFDLNNNQLAAMTRLSCKSAFNP